MLPLGLSVAQRHAQLAEQTVDLALSSAGQVVEATQCAHDIVEAAIVEAMSVCSQVESRVALLAAHAEVSMAQAVSALSKRIREVAAHTEEQTSRVVGIIAQQLEKRLKQPQ